jgi:signal transduction histidine kinase
VVRASVETGFGGAPVGSGTATLGDVVAVASASDLPFVLQVIHYTPLAFGAAAVSVGFALVMWRSRRAPGALALLALALGAAWWSFTYGLEQTTASLAGKLLFGRLSYLGIVVVPVAWFAFALEYTGHGERLTRRTLAALSLPAVVAATLPWTSGSSDLFWASATLQPGGTGTIMALEYGPAFWVWSAYAYVLLAGGTALLLWSIPMGARLFRAQTVLLLVGVAAPWFANVTYLARISPGTLDFTPIAFVVSALALGGGLSRYRLLDVHPASRAHARDELVEGMAEPVVVLNPEGLVVDLNASARAVLGIEGSDPIGSPLSAVAPDLDAVLPETGETTLLTTEDPARHYEVRVSSLSGDRRRAVGRLVTLRDVTERRRRELRIAVLNRVLRHDLRNDLSVVDGYARLLAETEGAEEYATAIAERASAALDLVETVRNVERTLEDGGPTRSAIDIVRVVDEQVAAARRSHPAATVETDLPDEATVHATDLVSSAVDNLVENAIEHNDTDSPHVRVSVDRVVDGDGPAVELRVRDDGPGIPPHERSVLVGEEGATLDDASGLGLWLVNWIVTESGGTVAYEPNEPRGSVVVVRLPGVEPGESEGDDDGSDPTSQRIPVEDPRRSRRPAGTGSTSHARPG